jgi:signal transduction histidine kinase
MSSGRYTAARILRDSTGRSLQLEVELSKKAMVRSECPFAAVMAARLRTDRDELVGRWLERIAARVTLDRNTIFPSDDLLDHVPLLVDGIADYVEDPSDEISTDVPVVAKALELGALRHSQQFDMHQVLREYEILGSILFAYLEESVDDIEEPCTRRQLVACTRRLFRSVSLIQQVTANEYMRLEHERVAQREQRLRGFNRALSHEIRNRIGAVQNAVHMLGESFVQEDEALRSQFSGIARENTRDIVHMIDNLVELSRTDADARRHRHVLLCDTAAEVKRQLREFAAERDVEVVINDMPGIEVPAALIELALSNYVSNAIKYHDPQKVHRFVEVRGWIDGHEVIVEVKDNGIGVPVEQRGSLFRRFFRGSGQDDTVEGTGLGLSIVREAMEGLGGRAWADFDGDDRTRFLLALPCRRAADHGLDETSR